MGYDLYISKHTFVPVENIQGIEFNPSTKTVVIKETILNLYGWEIAEYFQSKYGDEERNSGELDKDDIIKIYKKYCKIIGTKPIQSTLDMIESVSVGYDHMDSFFTYDESF